MSGEIPEAYRDYPEKYFAMLDKQETCNEIKQLEGQIEELRKNKEEYRMALYEIATIIRVWKPRGRRTYYKKQVCDILEVLSKFPEETKEIELGDD